MIKDILLAKKVTVVLKIVFLLVYNQPKRLFCYLFDWALYIFRRSGSSSTEYQSTPVVFACLASTTGKCETGGV